MIQSLLETARAAELKPGDCLEVHIGPGPENETIVHDVHHVHCFCNRWNYAMELSQRPSVLRRYLGVVHEDGAMIVPF